MTEKNLHPDAAQPAQDLTHVRADGSAHMVDVTLKEVTTRTARAEGTVPRILFHCATRCRWVKLPWILSVARTSCASWRR